LSKFAAVAAAALLVLFTPVLVLLPVAIVAPPEPLAVPLGVRVFEAGVELDAAGEPPAVGLAVRIAVWLAGEEGEPVPDGEEPSMVRCAACAVYYGISAKLNQEMELEV
jgi:hypothetical protein